MLSEPERTTALYSLLQHTSPVQLRFFTTVLKQMATKLNPTSSSKRIIISTTIAYILAKDPIHPTPAVATSSGPTKSSFLSPEYKAPQLSHSPIMRPRTPTDDAIDSADWSVGGASPRMVNNYKEKPKVIFNRCKPFLQHHFHPLVNLHAHHNHGTISIWKTCV